MAKGSERLLGKTKKGKNISSDEAIGVCKSSSKFKKGPIIAKATKDGERLPNKTEQRRIKENRAFDESVGVYKSLSKFEKRPKTWKGKDGERLLVKVKKRKIKTSGTFDESIEAYKSPLEFEKEPKIQDGKNCEWLLVKAKKRKIKEDRTSDECPSKFEKRPKTQIGKFKKNCKHEKMHLTNAKKINIEEVQKVDEEKVDEISSVDDDCTRGMKKWLTQYKESRPGLEVLQQRIDEFVMAHEERLEQERKEREAQAAEDGWTVVVHHKGRKKTTDAETGTTVGSVASAAVMDKMSKKKGKEIALDFYRFQKREAKRNEVMMLQSKFEQDKKRIQQLRAARKFRPS